ncbi:MAG: hypothetical protein M9890_01840 [Thermomicrobiales bacterium]|nr:hypothetical protein [Thermomicrobiales bacterium]
MTSNAEDADARIAAAEQRLADALQALEDARATLALREHELLDLLAQFGRLPAADETTDANQGPAAQ